MTNLENDGMEEERLKLMLEQKAIIDANLDKVEKALESAKKFHTLSKVWYAEACLQNFRLQHDYLYTILKETGMTPFTDKLTTNLNKQMDNMGHIIAGLLKT